MTIKAIPMYKDGFVQQPFVFGGEEGIHLYFAELSETAHAQDQDPD